MDSVVNKPNTVDNKLHGRLELMLLLVSLALYLLFAFVLSPMIIYANNDATVPYLPDILSAIEWILNLCAFFICYAITEYCIYRFSFSKTSVLIATFSVVTVSKYLLNMVSAFFVFDTVPASKEDLKKSVTQVVVNALIELAQYTLVFLSSFLILRKSKKLTQIAEKNASKIGVEYDARKAVLPINKLFSAKNPLQHSALISAIIVTVFKMSNRIVYDVWFGLPTSLTDGLWIVAAYFSDLLFGFIGYLIMLYVFNKCDTRDIKLKVKYFNEKQ